MIGFIFMIVIVWTIGGIFAYHWIKAINKDGAIVRRGIPDPQTIRLQFIQSMGREPTVEEVAALHQMAKSQYNQALLGLGVNAAAAGAVFHTARTGKIL